MIWNALESKLLCRCRTVILLLGLSGLPSLLAEGGDRSLGAYGMLFQVDEKGVVRRDATQVEGYRVRAVAEDSPARLAGLREGDLIVSVDGVPVTGEPFKAGPSGSSPGRKMVVGLIRGGIPITIQLGAATSQDPLVTGVSSKPTSEGVSEKAATSGIPVPAQAAAPGFAVGRISFEDGTRLTGNIVGYAVAIYGTSAAAERVSYSPVVRPDGTYRQRLVPGNYTVAQAFVTLRHKGVDFRVPLEPVGDLADKSREAEDGIVQDFVWKVTGPTPRGRSGTPNPSEEGHWHGAHIRLTWQTFQQGKGSTKAPPDGTRLVFTCRPVSSTLDGRNLKPFTLERSWTSAKVTRPDDLNDLPPADYEVTGEARLPDGTTKPILFQGPMDYPKFVPVLKAPLLKGDYVGAFNRTAAGFLVE